MTAAEQVERLKRDNQRLTHLLREERLTTDWLHEELDGANDEIHQRDLRLKEKDRYIQQLLQRIDELKNQAAADVQPSVAGATPPEVPWFVKNRKGVITHFHKTEKGSSLISRNASRERELSVAADHIR